LFVQQIEEAARAFAADVTSMPWTRSALGGSAAGEPHYGLRRPMAA
jgi:hypothetical protein